MEHPARDAYWRLGSICEDWNVIQFVAGLKAFVNSRGGQMAWKSR